jgi:hypothetical protein
MAKAESLSREDIGKIVQEQIRHHDFEKYVMQMIQGADLDSRMRESIRRLIPEYMSTHVSRSVEEYSRLQLPDKIRLGVIDELRRSLPDLVRNIMMDRLGHLSGVTEMLTGFKHEITDKLNQQRQGIQEEFLQHRKQLQGIQDENMHGFKRSIELTANNVVQGLVGTNGQVLQGFRDELVRGNNAQFETLRAMNQVHLIDLNKRCNRLEATVSTTQWLLYAVGFGLACSMAATTYLVWSK